MEIEPKKLMIGLTIVFLLGIMFAIVNGYYVTTEESNLPIITYGIDHYITKLSGGNTLLERSKK